MNNIKHWFIIGTIFSIVVGTLLHFVYQWSNENPIVGIFAPINESVWEHLKLLFWPGFFFMIFEYIFIGNKYYNYINAKAISFYIGVFLIVSLFYTYSGILGTNFFIADILIFLISVIVSQYVGYKITIIGHEFNQIYQVISAVAIAALIFGFIIFTFNPPNLPIFISAE